MADLIVYNAHVLTQDAATPVAQAFAVTAGRITALGDTGDILALKKGNTKVIDAAGKTVLPGFIDAHIHIWKVGNLQTFLLDVRGVTSIKALQDKLADFMEKNPGTGWIQARGFNEANMQENRLPTKEDLNKVSTERPIWLIRTCAHIGVANSKAIELSNVDENTPVPAGGEMRMGNDGKPNGIFTETALGLIANCIPPYSADDYSLMIKAAEKEMLQYGITAVTDPAVMPDLLECYEQMHRENKLVLRINALPVRVPDGGEQSLPVPGKYVDEMLQVHTVKFFADGGLSGMTAAVNKPYKNSTSHGVLRLTTPFFYPLAKEAAAKGFGIATHAIGDKAIDVVLEVYTNIRTEYPHTILRIEHLGLPTTLHLQQMKTLNIHCVSQSIFLKELGKNFGLYLEDERLHKTYPYRSVVDAGINLALSSDAPVVKDFNPISGIRAAIWREDVAGNVLGTDESITYREAIYAYTMGGAIANGTSHFNGSISIGKVADFIVLNKTIGSDEDFATENDLHVKSTFINGVEVFSK